MKKIYVLLVRTTDTEWTALKGYATRELAEQGLRISQEWDADMKLSIKFLYKIEEIYYCF